MGVLDSFFTGNPGTTNTASSSQTQTPGWYQDINRSVAAQAANQAANPYQQYQGPRVADWTQEHGAALQRIREGTGLYDNNMNLATSAVMNAPTQASQGINAGYQAGQAAQQAVGAPSQAWPEQMQKYMSPYTAQVVDNIARLGQRNMTENLLPKVNNSFIGAGGFGSTRNAEILGRTMRDVNADILGKQSEALQSGYKTSADIFGSDANRAQQQQSLQAQTNLNAGSLYGNTARGWSDIVNNMGQQVGALSQTGQNIRANDTNNLIYAGDRQQAQQQKGLDNQYQDWKDYQNWDWNQLNNLTGALSKMQVPTSTTTNNLTSGTGSTPSQAGMLTSLIDLWKSENP